jgi:hypothetical protein
MLVSFNGSFKTQCINQSSPIIFFPKIAEFLQRTKHPLYLYQSTVLLINIQSMGFPIEVDVISTVVMYFNYDLTRSVFVVGHC